MRQRHELLDPIEFERRVRESKSAWIEGTMIGVADVIVTAFTLNVWPWFVVLPSVGVASVITWVLTRGAERLYARRHRVPIAMYKEELAKHVHEPYPRVRVDIVEQYAPESKHETGTMPHLWGLRVSNEGAPAVFQALLEVKAGMVGIGGRKRYVVFSRSGETRSHIATGSEDTLFFGRVDCYSPDHKVGPKVLLYFDEQHQRIVEAYVQGVLHNDGAGGVAWIDYPPEATADVEITITSEPQMANGTWRRSYRFGPDSLIELTPSAPQIVVHSSPESA